MATLRPPLLLALSLLGGCSFLSDFDRFHVADDAGTDAGSSDGGSDGGGSDGGSSDGGSDGGADAAIDGGSDAGTGCAAAPSGIDTETTAAFTTLTNLRSAAGTTCATMVSELNTAGSMHSVYYEANKSNASCVPDPHTEVSGCALFYGADVMARATAAGYVGTAVSQVMVFGFGSPANPASAIPMALDSLGRRLPLLSPWIRDFGYGHGTETGTLPFGVGASAPATWTATYPYANQTGVPRSYSGTGDAWVPAPSTGFPSGYPIMIFLQGTVTSHTLTVSGSGTSLAHQWLPSSGQAGGYVQLPNAYVLLPDAPLAATTTYRVQVEGTNANGAVSFDFTFTTKN